MMAQALIYDLRKFANPNKIIVLDIDSSRLDRITGDGIEKHQSNTPLPTSKIDSPTW